MLLLAVGSLNCLRQNVGRVFSISSTLSYELRLWWQAPLFRAEVTEKPLAFAPGMSSTSTFSRKPRLANPATLPA
jgi:hypothetical protein